MYYGSIMPWYSLMYQKLKGSGAADAAATVDFRTHIKFIRE